MKKKTKNKKKVKKVVKKKKILKKKVKKVAKKKPAKVKAVKKLSLKSGSGQKKAELFARLSSEPSLSYRQKRKFE